MLSLNFGMLYYWRKMFKKSLLQDQNSIIHFFYCTLNDKLTSELNLNWQMLHDMICFLRWGRGTPNVWFITAFWIGSICNEKKNTTNRNKACQFHWNVAYFIKEPICTASIYCSHYKKHFFKEMAFLLCRKIENNKLKAHYDKGIINASIRVCILTVFLI